MQISIHPSSSRKDTRHPALNILQRLRWMRALSAQRRTLANLPDHLLSDIGISAEAAAKEAGRAPWDVPAHWRG